MRLSLSVEKSMDRMQKIHEKYTESSKDKAALDSEVLYCSSEPAEGETVVIPCVLR